jgi:hypothetical protein
MTVFRLYLSCTLAAAVLAYWRTPSLPRRNLLLVIAAAPQLGSIFGIRSPGLLLVSVIAFIGWCVCNRGLAGVPIVAAGVGLNLLAMAFHNGAMPVQADVLAELGVAVTPGTMLRGSKGVVVQSTVLWPLSDWIVLPLGSHTFIASPGDLVVISGIAWWLTQGGKVRGNVDGSSRIPHPSILVEKGTR